MAHRTAAIRTTAILLLALGVPARPEELIGLDQGGQGRIETLQHAALAEAVARFARALTPDENAGERDYSWVPDWSDPSTRFGFAFPLTAGAVRTDPLLAPLRDRGDSWAPIEKVLSPPEK